MLSCASVDAQRNYKLISLFKPPKTPINKGFSLAHACAECAHTLARARSLRSLARSLRSRAAMRNEVLTDPRADGAGLPAAALQGKPLQSVGRVKG